MKYEDRVSDAVAALSAARELLVQDIADYPTPISGCDVQFNTLLSDRTRIASALQALDERPFVATPRILEADAGGR